MEQEVTFLIVYGMNLLNKDLSQPARGVTEEIETDVETLFHRCQQLAQREADAYPGSVSVRVTFTRIATGYESLTAQQRCNKDTIRMECSRSNYC